MKKKVEKKEPRQHTVSMPKAMYEAFEAEGFNRGLSVGEMARSVMRCWEEERPMPPRHLAAAPIVEAVPEPAKEVAPTAPAAPPAPPAPPIPITRAASAAPPAVPPVRPSSVPAEIVRQPDPDFDAPDALAEARRLLATRHEDVPF